VKDANGAVINGADVTFAITAGGGAISGAAAKSGSSGIATLGGWTTGATAGANRVTATAGTLPAVTFTAVATDPADGKPDLLAGAVAFSGAYPTPASVTYVEAGQGVSVTAFPGQVQLFFANGTTEVGANALIRANGGLILGQAPQMAYYLVGTPAGGESAFITAVSADARTVLALPHLATTYGSLAVPPENTLPALAASAPAVTVIDDCSGSHGTAVVATVGAAGGGTANCLSDAGPTPGTAALGVTVQHLLAVGAASGGADRLVNLSTYGTVVISGSGSVDWSLMTAAEQATLRRQWLGTFKNFLLAISSLPASARQNLVVGICAGNNNAPIASLLSTIRSDPRLGPILRQNVLVVGATDFTYAGANDAPGDPDFVKMPDASSNVTSEKGCSFATPRALVAVQQVIAATGLGASDALLAAKEAAAANADAQRLVTAEAISKGQDIAAARATDPAAASTVTAITLPAWGANNTAVITPAIQGVTVAYTVSGTDGYFDSARLRTNASGVITFTVPPGESGVTDTITVTAVLSGVSATRTYRWP